MKKIITTVLLALALATGLVGCGTTDSQVVDRNIGQDADNFKVLRRVVFINTVDNSYLLEVIGYCNITDQGNQIETICKVGEGYQKHMMGLGMNVTYVAQQLAVANVSPRFFKITIKPSTLVPDLEIR
jgi:hypothetical protein